MYERTAIVHGKEVRFKATAAVPRMYRMMYNRDIFFDFDKLNNEFNENKDNRDNSKISIEVLNIFEDIAYTMARHADPTIPPTVDEWLEGFDMFSIYEIMPTILELWTDNLASIAESKKNGKAPSAQ